jgi:hypothetical protein
MASICKTLLNRILKFLAMETDYDILAVFDKHPHVQWKVKDEFVLPIGMDESLFGFEIFLGEKNSWEIVLSAYKDFYGNEVSFIEHWQEVGVNLDNPNGFLDVGGEVRLELSPVDSYAVQAFRIGLTQGSRVDYIANLGFVQTSDGKIVLTKRGGEVGTGKVHTTAGLMQFKDISYGLGREKDPLVRGIEREIKEELGEYVLRAGMSPIQIKSSMELIGVAKVTDGKIKGHKFVYYGTTPATSQELIEMHARGYGYFEGAYQAFQNENGSGQKAILAARSLLLNHSIYPSDAWEASHLVMVKAERSNMRKVYDDGFVNVHGTNEPAPLLSVVKPGLDILIRSGRLK